MIYKVEEDLKHFRFWGQAQTVAQEFTDEQLDQLENILADMGWDDYPTDTQINDLFAYDSDYLKELLGWKKLSSGEYIDPDDLPEADDKIDYDRIFDLIKFSVHSESLIADPIADIAEKIAEEAEEASEIGKGIEVPTIEEFIDLLECFQAGYTADELSTDEYPCLLLPSIPSMLNHASRIIEEMDLDAMRELIED